MTTKPLILIHSSQPGVDNASTWGNVFSLQLTQLVPEIDWFSYDQLWVNVSEEVHLLHLPFRLLHDVPLDILHIDFKKDPNNLTPIVGLLERIIESMIHFLENSKVKAIVVTGLTRDEAEFLPATCVLYADPTTEVFGTGAVWQSMEISYQLTNLDTVCRSGSIT